jgi:hypothetical protein
MIASGLLIQQLQDIIDDHSNETYAKIIRHINLSYLQLAEEREWSTLVVPGLSLNGTLCPADMVRPVYAQDDTGETYFRISEMERYYTRRANNYYFNVVNTPLLTGTDLVTTLGSTSVTSATGGFTDAMVGEYITVGTNPAAYKIAALVDTNGITLANAFGWADWTDPDNPASLTAQYFEVRPKGTLQIARTDQNGDTLTASSFKLWYLQRPLPVYNAYDKIMLPGGCDALMIKVLRTLMISAKYDNDALKQIGDYEQALERMKKGERQFWMKFEEPRDAVGLRVRFGRNCSRNAAGIHDGAIY